MESIVETAELRKVIEDLHKCKASYKEQIIVIEKCKTKIAWKGIVYLFRLEGHAQADLCYAWYSTNPKTKKRQYYAVLHVHPIDSPSKAVRASIVPDINKS